MLNEPSQSSTSFDTYALKYADDAYTNVSSTHLSLEALETEPDGQKRLPLAVADDSLRKVATTFDIDLDSRPRAASVSSPTDWREIVSESQKESRPASLLSRPLQQWYGAITEVRKQSIVARLIDPTGSEPDTDAEIPFSLIGPQDPEKLQIGAAFYWTFNAIKRGAEGTDVVASFRFRRLPKFDSYHTALVQRLEDRLQKL